ncbi:filamentous hemagglutinin N-terminal domain-containing protein [Herbaspirillum sp. WKF16]|uniref:beta strand repeat-containing protein n=1 Tax=Herbaspirillum sp. WKF16 TaxID=3028312 RepID=UPI0023A9D9F8|nr:filamentous hemagglutinin N-terminal domain-containing protein [Herbaspirillum sp. WKF16]WDZ94258.1 filamentous hemagglutinin N-terminal domain-containing protein [Herbaspirillum sp. WKF16]
MNHRPPARRPRLPALSPIAHAALCAAFGLAPLTAAALDAGALPTNGQIVAGSGAISSSGNTMTVTQNSGRMVTNWDTFNIGSAASVNFVQPTSSSVALNRVLSSDASQIMGALNANGQVYLVNPNGVLFGAGSSVSVGGLVASTLNISDANFMAGRNVFELEGGNGTVVNLGNITATDGGYVALLGAQVRNEGAIAARLGSVALGAGQKITLDFNGDGLINMEVNNPAVNAGVANAGLIQANGGTVLMSAHAGNALMAEVVNNSGIIEATSLQQRNGVVVLDGGDSGVVANRGVIDVSGRNAGETGGSVKLLGQYVGMFDGSRIDASGDAGGGTVLAGGDYQGGNGVFQASATYMDANASIDASARSSGNGGKVILWSEDATRFYGDINVAGGAAGAGGLVETSGHYLDVSGAVNLSRGGTWLLDPVSINITSGASSGMNASSPFQPSGTTNSTLSSATLNASLSEGANIIVQTTTGGAATGGDITVSDNIRAVGNASLTLLAHRNISMTNTSISNAAGKTLNVTLNSSTAGNGSIALSNASITTNGGNITLISNTTGGNGNATAIAGGSTLDAGGGNINISAIQGNAGGTGDAFILTGGSKLLTSGAGSIKIDSTNLGSGNATRIFSTNNTIAATGSGDVNISGNATSGFGVLICSTAATSSQNITVGSGNLTIQANANGFAGSGRGVFIAANTSSGSGGNVKLAATAGGNITISGASSAGRAVELLTLGAGSGIALSSTTGNISITGSSGGSYGALLNGSAAASTISVLTGGNIAITGNSAGGTTPSMAFIASGAGTSASAPGANITVRSSAGNVNLAANNTQVNNSSGSFKALSLDAGGAYATINVGATTGQLRLDGTSASGRGVDISPSGANAAINLSTTSGDIVINGNSTNSFGGYGIFFNSTGGSQGVTVSTTTGNITLTGDSVGTSDAIALGGNGTASANRITSQGGNITLNGNFHSPNLPELDHGIAILSVTNVISTTGNGNVTLTGNAGDQGNGVAFYGNGRATVSVENGKLSITGTSNYGDGIGMQTGINTIRATGSGSVALNGSSVFGSGISIYPSGNASANIIATVSGDLALTGVSSASSSAAGILIRAAAATPANGVSIASASGNVSLSGTGLGSGEGISFVGTSSNGYNTVAAGGSGNLNVTAISNGAYGLRFNGGNNALLVQDGVLSITARAAGGTPIGQSGDTTTIAALGSGVVIRNLGGFTSNTLTNPVVTPASTSVQSSQVDKTWITPAPASMRLTPIGGDADRVSIDLAQLGRPVSD